MLNLPGRLVWNEDKTVRVTTPFAGRVMDILGATRRDREGRPAAGNADLARLLAWPRPMPCKAAADSAVAAKSLARQRELYGAGIVAQKELEQAQADSARAAADQQRTQAALRNVRRGRRWRCGEPALRAAQPDRGPGGGAQYQSRAWNCVRTRRPARRCS